MLTLLVAVACGCTEADFHPYSGAQGSNPTAVGSFIDTKYAVPVYYGYPPRGYRVLGEMETETRGRFRNAWQLPLTEHLSMELMRSSY